MQKYAKYMQLICKICKICILDFHMQNMQEYALPTLLMKMRRELEALREARRR